MLLLPAKRGDVKQEQAMTTTVETIETTGPALIARAEALAPLVRREAAATEAGRRLTDGVQRELLDAGFYRITMPPEYGTPATLVEAMRILETLARADGSTAWSVWAGLGGPAMSAFLDAEGAHEMFSAREAVNVGSVAAIGRAVLAEGGVRVTGRWPFASNIHHATYCGGLSFLFREDGSQVTMPDGQPAVVVPFWPVDACTVIDTWYTTGLRGTGSDDVAVEDLFVPQHRIVDFSRPPRPGLSELHYIHVDNAANITVAAIGLGIAQAALDAFAELAGSKRSMEGERLADSPLAKLTLSRSLTQLSQARGHLYEIADLMQEEMLQGSHPGPEWFARTSLASVGAVDAAVEAVTRLYRAACTSAIRASSPLDRCLRDIFTLQAHKTVQHVNLLKYGAIDATAGLS
jgi:alkylation response protein AidB-like acyl-CoA dehydrogenase